MDRRFPTVEEIKEQHHYENPDHHYAAMTGALSAMYTIATAEFETLRKLAQDALDYGGQDCISLQGYLDAQQGIAELYKLERDVTAA